LGVGGVLYIIKHKALAEEAGSISVAENPDLGSL
jgi:hypothetical protein